MMTPSPRAVAVLVLWMGLAAALPAPAARADAAAEPAARVSELERENRQLRQQVAELTALVAELRERLAEALPARDEASPEIAPGPGAAAAPSPERLAAERQRIERQRQALENRARQLDEREARLDNLRVRVDPAERAERQQARFTRRYDEQAEQTIVSSPATSLALPTLMGPHEMQLTYRRPGRSPEGPPERVMLKLSAYGSGGAYRHLETIDAVIDGQRRSWPVVEYDSRVKYIGGRNRRRNDDEFLTVAVDRAALREVAEADRVVLSFGRAEAELTLDQLATFRAVQARVPQAEGR